MRRDATIALARRISAAPVIASEWSVEGENEFHVDFIKEQLLPLRQGIVSTAIYGYIDYGWKTYEKVYQNGIYEEVPVYELQKIKALKNDITWALYNEKGDLSGLENDDQYLAAEILIDAEHSLFINLDDEGLGQYAEPLLLAAYEPWLNAKEANKAASNYDRKISGEHWVVHYPVGRTPVDGINILSDGDDGRASNDQIAAMILKQLCASGSVTIPVYTEQIITDITGGENPTGWKIELLSSSGLQSSFVDRLKYLDTLKVRALIMPERALLEGQFGTKAEAGEHADMAVTVREIWHEQITQQVNEQVVNELLEINFGVRDTVKLVAMPLANRQKAFYSELFFKVMDNPEIAPEILDGIDFGELRGALDVPLDEASVEAKEEIL